MNPMTEKQMADLSPEAQAKKAIGYTLRRIHDDPHIGWYMSYGTQTFALLCEAYSTLSGMPMEKVQDMFACPNAENPVKRTDD